ncbi:MAG TPA: hypothetical protein VNI02_08845 [Blastocatellia bacterium]|jgi:hypothetical protein|nr:hypothetical protein [Blastocatellia bacterium]
MLKRMTTVMIAALLAFMAVTPIPADASTKAEKDARHVEKVRAGISKLGAGRDARVAVRLRDKTKVAGYISKIENDSFVVTDLKTSEATTIAYPDVVQVKGNNLSTSAKIAIGVGIAVGVIIVLYLVRGAFCDGQC